MSMTSTHPLYDRFLPEWRFLRAAWQGTAALLRHGALPRHPRESDDNYQLRCTNAISFNYTRSIVDIYLHYLFEQPARRELGPLADDRLFQAFLHDTDLDGRDYDVFWLEAQQTASIMGHVGILVNKQQAPALSRADELRQGLHPYYAVYPPDAILDWRHQRDPTGRCVTRYLKLRDDDGTIHVWTPDHWERWQPASDGQYHQAASGPNPLGVVPFTWHLNTRSDYRGIGISDIQDVARLDVSIMRNISQADEVIDLAAFPMLMVPRPDHGDPVGDPAGDVAVGPRAILDFDPRYPEAKPDWLRAEVLEPIDAILRFIQLKVDEIYRMTNTRGESLIDQGGAPSGRALQVIFRQLNAKLASKATHLDESEQTCLRYWLAWQKQDDLLPQISLRRPRQFDTVSLHDDLKALLQVRDQVPSATFRGAISRQLVRYALPHLSPAKQRQVDQEIDAAEAHR